MELNQKIDENKAIGRYDDTTIRKLVKFGNYLLSDGRKNNFVKDKDLPPVKDRMKNVTHADLSNYFSMSKVNVKGYNEKP